MYVCVHASFTIIHLKKLKNLSAKSYKVPLSYLQPNKWGLGSCWPFGTCSNVDRTHHSRFVS